MKSKLYFILVFILSLLFASSGQGDQHEALPEQEQNVLEKYPDQSPSLWQEGQEKESDTFQTKFFHMLFILALLIAFMFIASWSLKRMMRSKATNLNQSSNIKVMETRYLSPRATLYLVEINDQQILIAESPTHVAYLANLSEKK